MAFSFPPNSPVDAPEFFDRPNRENDEFEIISSENCKSTITYTENGRKMKDGSLVDPHEPETLWKETIVRNLSDQFLKATADAEAKTCEDK